MEISLLYNTISGNGKGKKIATQLTTLLSENKIKVEVFENNWPQEFADSKFIWLIGGDGTLNYFINKYKGIKNPIALFPGGTGNDLYWKIYGEKDYMKQYQSQIQHPKIKEIDIAQCNNEYFINMVGIGFDGEVLKSMKTARWLGGHLGYLLIVLKHIFTYKEQMYELTFLDKSETKNCLLLSISNSSRTGGGFHVSPLAKIDDGLLNVIYCNTLGILDRLHILSKVEKGKHLNNENITHRLTKSINIKAQQQVNYQLDGELRTGKEFIIEILNDKINFLV